MRGPNGGLRLGRRTSPEAQADARGVEWSVSGVHWGGVEWSRVEWSGVEWSGLECEWS